MDGRFELEMQAPILYSCVGTGNEPRGGGGSRKNQEEYGACKMSVPQSVADVIDRHVTFELESLDRMSLTCINPCFKPAAA